MAASEIEKLERMVRENPKGRLFASLADAYRKDGQYPKALEVLEAGLVNHPDYVSARVVLGRVHLATGDRAKAREAFARVVQLDPESVIALKALADLAEEEGQGEEALRWSGQLLTVDPGNDDALRQQERLASAAPAPAPAAAPAAAATPEPAPEPAAPEIRLSGIVPMMVDEPPAAPPADPEKTAAPFEAVKPPVVKTVEIPVITNPGAPAFAAAPEPLEQAPEPLPLMPLSEEAQTEQVAGTVTPLMALEPTSFEGGAGTPTERMPGLDPTGLSADEVAAIGAAPGFEPTSGPLDTTDLPRTSMVGLESLSGEAATDEPPPAVPPAPGLEAEPEVTAVIPAGGGVAREEPMLEVTGEAVLEREVEIELGAAGSNEFQEDSVAETLRRRSGANEFQVASDADLLDADSAATGEAIETGGTDLAFIEPESSAPMEPPAYAPPPEEPEPAMTEPEPVVTESMAELYASQGHLADALYVYRQLALRDPMEPRFQERIVELEMYVGGMMPAAQATEPPMVQVDEMAAAPSAEGSGVSVGSWLASVFSESLPGVTPAAEPMVMDGMGMDAMAVAPEPMEPEPVVYTPDTLPSPPSVEPPLLDLASAAELPPPPPPRGEPTRPASGAFSLSNVFEEPKPAAGGSFDDFFGAPPSAAPAATTPPASGPAGRSTRPSGAQPPATDDVASFQDWLKGLKK